MNIRDLVKVLASTGIAATVVTGAYSANSDNGINTVEAAEAKNMHYEYQGDTGYGDGSFLLNDALKKTLEEDGDLTFNGHDIEASEADYDKRADDKSETVEEHDQKFTLRDGTATKVVFPIHDEELSIDDVTEVYGDDFKTHESKNGKYKTYVYLLGDQKDEAEKNVLAFKVEGGYVIQGTIGYSSSY